MVTGAFKMDADNSFHKQAAQVFNGRGESSRSDASEAQPNAKRVKVEKELTFKDMYENKELFEEDDEEDTDWEPCPVEKCVEVIKWFCRNCTMDNLDNDICCEVCGEHKDSKILTLGHFASPFAQDGNLNEIQPSMKVMRDFDSQESAANSSTAIGFDERMLLHAEVEKKSHPHPERPDRLRAIVASLTRAGIFPGRCYPIPAREITQEELMMVHSSEHIESVEVTSKLMSSYFTSDTYANKHSACAARLAAGLCADLASAIVSGRVKNGFALVRPPGHHAGVKDVMGFCLHNNAAVAALAAQAAGAKKVLILDWDVHHGNGTQEIFEKNKSVLYISLHRHEGGAFYPGTGGAHEVGYMGAEGYCVNIPWSRGGVSDNDYNFAFQHVVLPIASEFAPDFTIISAGFDAARGDPLGGCDITPSGYAQMTHMLNALSGGKMLVILEGGYNLRSISSSATAVIKVLLGESHVPELENSFPTKSGLQTVFEVLDIQNNFWPSLKPIFENVMSLWEMRCLGKKGNMEECRERLLKLTQEKKNHKRPVKPHQPTRLGSGSEPVRDGSSGSSGARDTIQPATVLSKKKRSEGGYVSAVEEEVTARAFNLPPCFVKKDFFDDFPLTVSDAESDIIRRLDDEGRRKHLASGMVGLMKVAEMAIVLAGEGSDSSGLVKELESEKVTLQAKTQKLKSALERSEVKFRVQVDELRREKEETAKVYEERDS